MIGLAFPERVLTIAASLSRSRRFSVTRKLREILLKTNHLRLHGAASALVACYPASVRGLQPRICAAGRIPRLPVAPEPVH